LYEEKKNCEEWRDFSYNAALVVKEEKRTSQVKGPFRREKIKQALENATGDPTT